MIISGVSYLIYLLYTGTTDWLTGVIIFALSQLQLIVPLIISPKFYDNYEEGRECEAKATNVEIEAHTAFRDIKIFRLRKWYSRYLEKYQNRSSKVAKKQEYLIGMGTSLETMVASIIKYGTYIIIGIFVFQGRFTADVAVLLLFLSNNTYTSLLDVYGEIECFLEDRMAKERLKKVSGTRNKESPYSLYNKKDIQLENCKVTSDTKAILEIGNFSVKSDVPNIITGENGSGKSTLLKVLGGFILPDNCKIISSTEDFDSGVFYLPQDDLLLQESALELVNASEQGRYVRFCKDRFDLGEEKLWQPIRTLSGGERKKIFLTLSFLKRSNNFLLLDEPTNHLDYSAKQSLAQIISEHTEKIVIVSHDDEFIEVLGTKTEISEIHLVKRECS